MRKRISGNIRPRNLVAVKQLYAQYRFRARNKGLSFDLSTVYFQELIQRDCIYCGNGPRNLHKVSCGHRFFYQGIDRVINEEGYTEANSVPCCAKCNAVKSNVLTAPEMLAAMRAIKRMK